MYISTKTRKTRNYQKLRLLHLPPQQAKRHKQKTTSTMSSSLKRKTDCMALSQTTTRPFLPKWESQVGIQVCARDSKTSKVTSAKCLFCLTFGREEEDNQEPDKKKRRKTSNTKFFNEPWRIDNIKKHMVNQHSEKFEEYKSLSHEEKKIFFLTKNNNAQIGPEGQDFINIDSNIVEKIIDNLLINTFSISITSETENLKNNGLILIKKNEFYCVKLKSILKMNIIRKLIAAGISFKQIEKSYQIYKEETNLGTLGTVNKKEIIQLSRIICIMNLQFIKNILKNIWAFSIAFDAGNNLNSSYLDVRIRFYYKNKINNIHLLAIPMKKHHTGKYQFDLIVKVLDIIIPLWRVKLIGITTDGASAMVGSIQGTCTRLAKECKSEIFRIWCGTHQLDLALKKSLKKIFNNKFIRMVTTLSNHLRRQKNFNDEQEFFCPSYVSTRWISMGKTLSWLKNKRVILLNYFIEKNYNGLQKLIGGLFYLQFNL